MFKKFMNSLLIIAVFSLSGFVFDIDVSSYQASSGYTNVAYTIEINGDLPDQH